jgi:hypothetical protein
MKFSLLVFMTCLAIVFAGACTEEKKPEADVTRVAMPIKRPMPKPPPQSDQTKKKDKTNGLKPPFAKKKFEPLQNKSVEGGYYRVQKGDSLMKVAGLEEVYADPIKWTSLFRMNLDKLDGIEVTSDLHNRELSTGLDLKFVTESEAEENRKKLGLTVYSVNVLSAETSQKIVPRAITLMKNGYNAYICTATVKGKKWLRLRAGFFKGYTEAVEAGEHIKTIVDETNVWVARVKKSELEQFGGY